MNKARAVTAYKDIFGLDLEDTARVKALKGKKGKKGPKKKKAGDIEDGDATTPEVKKSKKGGDPATPVKEPESPMPSTSAQAAAAAEPTTEKPRKGRKTKKMLAEEAARAADSDDNYVATEDEEKLQTELQMYALDLLEGETSWEKRTIIQNLVIWEPVTDPKLLIIPPSVHVPGTVPGLALPPGQVLPPPPKVVKRKGKKMRKRQSGLDFSRKKPAGKSSRDVSRATSPTAEDDAEASHVGAEVKEVAHTLDHVYNEAKHMVLDKSAGETILHRASKMGYPDVVAYALDMLKMSATIKDNAGIPPLQKAAFRGHAEVVDYLIRFGADPNTNVKGTRPLHEALDNNKIKAVHQLLKHGADAMLYDYSGNMPMDLANDSDNPELQEYFSSIVADLHGKTSKRWNIEHEKDFVLPQDSNLDECKMDEDDPLNFEFEMSSQPLPAQFKLYDQPGKKFVLASDLKPFTSLDAKKLAAKFNTLEMKKEDFLRRAVNCLVGGGAASAAAGKTDSVLLVEVDAALKKLMGVDDPKLSQAPSSSSPSKGKAKAKSPTKS